MFKRLSLSLGILALILSACRAPIPVATTADELLTPVSFVRSGGFAGLLDQIEIATDGTYTITHRDGSGQSGQLTASQSKVLAALLAESKLFDADHSFETPGADQFVYNITYNGHTVTAVDGAVPEALASVLDYLTALMQP